METRYFDIHEYNCGFCKMKLKLDSTKQLPESLLNYTFSDLKTIS